MSDEIEECVWCGKILTHDEKEVYGNTCYLCRIEGNEEDEVA